MSTSLVVNAGSTSHKLALLELTGGGVAADLLHGEEKVVYGDAGYQGLEKREEMAGPEVDCRIAMRAGKHRHPPDDGEGAVQWWVERAKAHVGAKMEHP